jgi:hypothetical protein
MKLFKKYQKPKKSEKIDRDRFRLEKKFKD